ncbi:MAG TPA: threonine synthase [Solirubrobacterales bacterium]|jgi:threonine synthase|nr:threonine synthase [Solirubrobacterales bacterium]
MNDAVDPHLGGPGGPRTSSCATELVCRDCGYRTPLLDTAFKCPACGEGLDIDYDYERARRLIAERGMADRPWNIWRLEELLPIVSRAAQDKVGEFAGKTPLIRADRLGAELGLKRLYLKDDSTNRPTLSYKDRVVSMAIARLLELGKDEVGCVSTGNVGTAVSALAAKAGAAAYIFYPGNMEKGKAKACRALGAQVCQLDGNYDEANRACRELSLASGIQFANITLRPFYAEGAKTMAFEVAEELGWKGPDHFVIPAAGGTLSSRVHKGLNELQAVGLAETEGTKINIAQAGGCSPIATAILGGGEIEPQKPETNAHSLAIGAPGDGGLVVDAVRIRNGSAATATDPEIFAAIDLLGATEGILTEPAGGTTIAATARLAQEGKIAPEETVVAVISGNGLKTLQEHPDKPWPEMVACDVETMGEMLADFRQAAAAALH